MDGNMILLQQHVSGFFFFGMFSAERGASLSLTRTQLRAHKAFQHDHDDWTRGLIIISTKPNGRQMFLHWLDTGMVLAYMSAWHVDVWFPVGKRWKTPQKKH